MGKLRHDVNDTAIDLELTDRHLRIWTKMNERAANITEGGCYHLGSANRRSKGDRNYLIFAVVIGIVAIFVAAYRLL